MCKINLIGKSFDKESGQGIYRFSGELYDRLKQMFPTTINDNKNNKNKNNNKNKADVNIVMQPEQIHKALFKKNVITVVPDMIPIVYGERKKSYKYYFYFMMLLTVLKSKKIIAISESTKNDIIKVIPYAKDKVYVNHLWANDEFVSLYNKQRNKRIGYLGGLGKRKNVEYMLKLALVMPEYEFFIAGKGPMRDKLEKIKNDKKINNVTFVGHIPNERICEFYNSLDLFIFPSKYEGFGLPVVEAMKCGTPALVFNNSSLKELVPSSKYILQEKPNNSASLLNNARIINELSEEELKVMSVECMKKAEEFTIENFVEKLVNLL